MKALSLRKQKFVDAMLANPNATEAAKAAGYAPKTAKSAGSRLMADPEVKAALAARAEKVAESAELTAEYVIRGLKREAESAIESGTRVAALAWLGKHLKMFTEKLEHSGKDGAPLEFIVKGPG